MIALFWKELRGMQTFLLAACALLIVGHVYTLATEFPDNRPFTPSHLIGEVNPSATVAVLGMLLGVGLLIREDNDRTLSFLDALPVSRTSIFLAKITAGLAVLLLIGVFEISIEAIFGWLSQTSTDGPAPVRFTLSLLTLLAVTGTYVLSVSLVLSFLRKWFALGLGLAFWIALWLSNNGVSWVELLKPTGLVPSMQGETVQIPWRMLRLQAAIAIGALGIAWFLFLHLGMRREDVGRKFLGRRWRPLLVAILVAATPLVWIGFMVTLGRTDKPDAEKSGPLQDDAFAERKTEHYHFLFRETQRKNVTPMIDKADEVYATVEEVFTGTEMPAKIIVDLASPLPEHAGGMANWTHLRIPVWQEQPLEELLHVLGHETAHAFQHTSAGIRYLQEHRWTRFFNEGLATHIGIGSFASPEEQASWDRQIAGVASRGKIPFSQLSNDQEVSKHRDPEAVYPLGMAFCRAMEHTGGTEVFQKVMAAFPRLPKGVKWNGNELWRHICTEAGVDLDRVIAAYDQEVEKLLKEHAEFVAGLPVLTGTVSRDGSTVVIRTKYTGVALGKIVCCIKEPSFFGKEGKWHHADAQGLVKIPIEDLPPGDLRYMLGWSLEEAPWPIFEPWATGKLE